MPRCRRAHQTRRNTAYQDRPSPARQWRLCGSPPCTGDCPAIARRTFDGSRRRPRTSCGGRPGVAPSCGRTRPAAVPPRRQQQQQQRRAADSERRWVATTCGVIANAAKAATSGSPHCPLVSVPVVLRRGPLLGRAPAESCEHCLAAPSGSLAVQWRIVLRWLSVAGLSRWQVVHRI